MSNVYENNYGVTINGKHSFRDYGLYPRKKFTIDPPEPRTRYLDIPGVHGSMDISELLTNEIIYDSRRGTFEFTIADPRIHWNAPFTHALQDFHGKTATVILDEEPDVYLTGRLSVEPLRQVKNHAVFTVEGRFDPWKREIQTAHDEWLWDTFSFETGVIRAYKAVTLNNSTKNVTVISSPLGATPKFYVDGESAITLSYNGAEYYLQPNGWRQPADLIMPKDYSEVTFSLSGTGTVTIDFEVGRL